MKWAYVRLLKKHLSEHLMNSDTYVQVQSIEL